MTAPRWISTNGPTNGPSPMVQPYRFAGSTTVTFSPNVTFAMSTFLIRGSLIKLICAVRAGPFQNGHDFPRVRQPGERRGFIFDAINKMLRLDAERFHEFDLRQQDVAAAII